LKKKKSRYQENRKRKNKASAKRRQRGKKKKSSEGDEIKGKRTNRKGAIAERNQKKLNGEGKSALTGTRKSRIKENMDPKKRGKSSKSKKEKKDLHITYLGYRSARRGSQHGRWRTQKKKNKRRRKIEINLSEGGGGRRKADRDQNLSLGNQKKEPGERRPRERNEGKKEFDEGMRK